MAHSLSPLLHRTAYDVLGLRNWTYDAIEVTEEFLPHFVKQMDTTWAGLSLTMPLKATILPLLSTRSTVVDAVGAANTVLPRSEGLHGENTDVPGLVAACEHAGAVAGGGPAVVLGAGATARSAIAALGHFCCAVTAYTRSPHRSAELLATAAATGVALEIRPWQEAVDALSAPLVVNTTPAGAADALAPAVPAHPHVLFDVVYAPWPTPLATAWGARSGQVVGGLELLVQQAVRQVALMTGLAVDGAALASQLRVVGAAALGGRT